MFKNIKVVKRDGKKVDFDGTKIALAIKKGFDSITYDGENLKYTENDVNKVYNLVINEIIKLNPEKIKIEEIQDMIEENLKKEDYLDVYKSFSEYRERRAQSRRIFFEEKKQHKFLKSLEDLTLRTSVEENVSNPLELMVDYGSTISREFAKSYIVKKKVADSQEIGDIHIHDLNFMPLGTTTSSQIDLAKLFNEGFKTKNVHIRKPRDIMSYSALAVLAITINQKEQHGCQSIPAFDYYMAPGVLCTFKKQLQLTINDILAYTDLDKFAATNGIEREIEKLETIQFDVSIFDKYSRDSEQLKRVFMIAYNSSIKKTKKLVTQAMEAFIHNVNVIDSNERKEKIFPTINLGTDTSPEGRMIIDKILDAIDFGTGEKENPVSPVVIFKVKQGKNYNKKDINYDLYKKAINISTRKKYPNFSFLDSIYNKSKDIYNNFDNEVAYNSTNMRVIDNIIDREKVITSKRGNLSYTTINLPRIGIKNSNIINKQLKVNKETQYKLFFMELEEKMDLVKEQLLDRFEGQGNKKAYEFPFLIGQGIWLDGEKVKPSDKIRKIIKQGSLSIGFIGLEECLIALTGKSHGEDKKASELGLEIVKFMRDKVDKYSIKYNLNFSLIGVDDYKLSEKFIALDKSIYGKLKGITDKNSYTNSFYINNYSDIKDKIIVESKYHELTNGGHKLNIKLKEKMTPDELEELLNFIKEKNIGYVSIN